MDGIGIESSESLSKRVLTIFLAVKSIKYRQCRLWFCLERIFKKQNWILWNPNGASFRKGEIVSGQLGSGDTGQNLYNKVF